MKFAFALCLLCTACASAPKPAARSPSAIKTERFPVVNYAGGRKALTQTVYDGKRYVYEICEVDFNNVANGEALIQNLNSPSAKCLALNSNVLMLDDRRSNSLLEKHFNNQLNAGAQQLRPNSVMQRKAILYITAMTTAFISYTTLATAFPTGQKPLKLNLAVGIVTAGIGSYAVYSSLMQFMENPPVTVEMTLQKRMQEPEYRSANMDITAAEIFNLFETSLRRALDQVLMERDST